MKAPTSRYGEVLNKNNRQINNLSVRTDDLVVKTSAVSETVSTDEVYIINSAGVIYYPGSGSNIFDPMLEGFYPVEGY